MSPYAPALLTAAALAMACVALHFEALRIVSSILPALAMPSRSKMLVVIGAVFLAHLAEVSLYAAAYWAFLIDGIGQSCPAATSGEQAVLISLESFASLGTNVCPPTGPLRLVAGSEALVGLVLVGWTASYTYLAMRELWGEQ